MTGSPKKLLLAYSGGLDTSYLVAHFTREEGYEVTTLHVNCGGLRPGEAEALHERALRLGAVEHLSIDARSRMFDEVLRFLIAGNVRRGGTYPLCVAAERGLQAALLAEVARDRGIATVAHGCTGAGNDQIRFEAALLVAAESSAASVLRVLAPVRDQALSREEECAYLEANGLPLPPSSGDGRYSVNAGLWGLTIGGGETHHSGEALPEEAWVWTRDGSGEAVFEVGFEGGIPVSLDGERLSSVDLIETLNQRAGALGAGRGYHLGDTLLGFKGRIGYEAPAADVLLSAHRELEKLVLVEDQRVWKDRLGEEYGSRLHRGLLFDPFLRDLEAFFLSSQACVTGLARVRVSGGSVLVEGVESPNSLMAASRDVYGEQRAAGADPASAIGLARAWSEPARLALRAQGASIESRASATPLPAVVTP